MTRSTSIRLNIQHERGSGQTGRHLHVVTARTVPSSSGSQRLLTSSAGTDSCGEPDEGHSVRLRDALRHRLDMSRLHPEYPDSESSDRWLPADILLREEPEEEEEDEEEQDRGEDEDGDDGYSE
jgi:hypothetical protein